MSRGQPGPGRLPGILLVLLMAVSCGRDDLPEVPRFEALGFTDALDAVRNQVLNVYEKWEEKPLDADRNGRLGMYLTVYGKLAAAEVLHRRARALAPDDFRWTYYLAVTLNELNRFDDAAAMFREALKIDPGYVNARIKLAKLLLQSSDTDESLRLYQSLTVEYPKRVEGWLGLGKAYSRMGDYDAAAAALQRARALGSQFGEVHYALAFVLRAMGDEDAAARELAIYERTAENEIRTLDPLIQKVQALYIGDSKHMVTASYHYGRAEFKKAAGSFRAALAVNPANADAWSGLISSQAKLGEIDAAGDTYREALAAGIAYARLHLTYGKALLDRQLLDAARDAIGQAILLDPQSAEAFSAMGELEMQSGASLAAVEQFRLSLLARPNDRRVRLSLVRALNTAGHFDEAAGQLELLTTDPALDKALTLRELAFAYDSVNRKDAAIEALQHVREAARKSNKIAMVDTIDLLLADWQKEPAE